MNSFLLPGLFFHSLLFCGFFSYNTNISSWVSRFSLFQMPPSVTTVFIFYSKIKVCLSCDHSHLNVTGIAGRFINKSNFFPLIFESLFFWFSCGIVRNFPITQVVNIWDLGTGRVRFPGETFIHDSHEVWEILHLATQERGRVRENSIYLFLIHGINWQFTPYIVSGHLLLCISPTAPFFSFRLNYKSDYSCK